MKQVILCSLQLLLLTSAQDDVNDAINKIFNSNSSDFLSNYEEVTPPPLKDFGALEKCGQGSQLNRFVCVPYYNCNPKTNTVQKNSELNGNRINIRFNEKESKCEHYLEVCCQISSNTSSAENTTPTIPEKPILKDPTINTPVTPQETTQTPITLSTLCGIRNNNGIDFTLSGKDNEAEFGEFPWMVAILKKQPANGKIAMCGGSLIAPNVVLTGAHCVHNVDINGIKIRAGEWDTQTENERISYQERNVINSISHEHFNPGNIYNNVALLILDRPLTKAENVGTACLPQQGQVFNSRNCFATGWGKDIFGQEGRYSVILKKIEMPLVQNKECEKALRTTRLGKLFVLHRSFICAGGERGLDTCTGDGGSPLVCPDPNNPNRYFQVGIVSWGIGCGESGIPGVYADVTQFRSWIDQKIDELGINKDPYIV